MFEYRKADRLANVHTTATSKSRVSPAGTLTSSEESQNNGLSYIFALKFKLARSASQVLAGPDSAPDTSNSSNATSIPRPQTEAEIRAEEQLADEKDRLAVAEELQRYISEGVLDDEDLESFCYDSTWTRAPSLFP